MQFIIKKDYESKYKNPIEVVRGTILEIERKDTEWVGWLFCHTKNKSGWIPKQIIDFKEENKGIAKETYTAKELNVKMGNQIEKVKELNGWAWCKEISNGEEGWIPLEIIELETAVI